MINYATNLTEAKGLSNGKYVHLFHLPGPSIKRYLSAGHLSLHNHNHNHSRSHSLPDDV